MTSTIVGEKPHVTCLVVDTDTVRYGGSAFRRVRKCRITLSDMTESMGQKMHRCSECGSLTTGDACFFEDEAYARRFRYCPFCGAKVVEK